MAQKRPFRDGRKRFKTNKKHKQNGPVEGSNEDILLADVQCLLKSSSLADSQRSTAPQLPIEVSLSVSELSSTGDGLAVKEGQVYVVPFTGPGDTVLARAYKHFSEHSYILTDFLKVEKPSPLRTETPKCPYFARCSGCQFQHLPYAEQLEHKRRVVEKAFQNFSNLPLASIGQVGPTIGSPQQYGYRTKLTPHFDAPANSRRERRNGEKVTWSEAPPIGFMQKGTRKTLDIEDCLIGTDAVREGLRAERARVQKEINKYQRGATLLVRENTRRFEDATVDGGWRYEKGYITDNNATSTEYVDGLRMDNPAGSFFQNNNSILPLVTKYIRETILGPQDDGLKIVNLIDAYCGSGFFTVTLSSLFRKSIGIDVSPQSITYAVANAELNDIPASTSAFIAADANELFKSVDKAEFRPEETAVILDPPRRGCDQNFIRQLLRFAPQRICYVSCNVHTQARDVGWLVSGLGDAEGLPMKGLYEIESLRGFDFFPQTAHVEGVAMLRKR